MSRYTVAAHHGESRSLFYVTDSEAPADEQPAVLMTCDRRTDADEIARDLEADHAARLARASQEAPAAPPPPPCMAALRAALRAAEDDEEDATTAAARDAATARVEEARSAYYAAIREHDPTA